MKQKILFILWGVLYLICGGLGHISTAIGLQAAAKTVMAVFFFVPGAILLADAIIHRNQKQLKQVRVISIASLVLTLVTLIANIAVVNAGETVGNVLHVILNWVSVPMLCSGHWVLSLFLWACLLFSSYFIRKD